MKKADAEKNLLEYIKEKGLDWYSRMDGEGRQRNNSYYCFNLKSGEQRFWTNPSDSLKTELKIE